MNADSNERRSDPAEETCSPCIPFCGLGPAGNAVLRLKQCGLQFLEQVRQPMDEQPNLMSHS